METAGSSRPASGSEHLISHALDEIATRTQLHGLQVGVATYVIARVQRNQSDRIARLFEQTGFWEVVRQKPFLKKEWLEAVRMAPSMKEDFYTVLSERDCYPEIARIVEEDDNLRGCFE
jgi:glycerol-1-phosphate dehydrogenase [NAD(P)+]